MPSEMSDSRDPLSLEYRKEISKLYVQQTADIFKNAQAYDTVVTGLGYAAFFGLWLRVATDISMGARAASVSLMGISLILYMTWHVLQMLDRSRFDIQVAETFSLADDPDAFFERIAKIERDRALSAGRLMTLWRPLFSGAVLTGAAAAAVLIWKAVMAALQMPLQLLPL
jgi:hypothetical protein